jgi:rod shape-determining protein MreD
VRRAALLAVASLAAILIQLTVLNRLPLPGGGAPDLVLVLVVVVALTGGPMQGMLTGFFAGLALDIAPPASHLVGQSALVFCLAGYAAGRLSGNVGSASWQPLGAVALCTAGGEALYAAAGMLFGEPGVTWPAVRHVLPVSVGYDLLVCPFALYAAVAAGRWAAGGFLVHDEALAGPAPVTAGGAIRDTGMGRSPRLRAAAARHGDGWIGGASQRAGRAAAQALAARPVHLRLRGGQAGSARGNAVTRTPVARPVHMRFGHGRGGSASAGHKAKARPVRPVHLRLGSARRRDGAAGGSVLGGRGLGGRGPGGRGPGLGGRMLGRNALRGRVPRGSALRRSGPGGSSLSGGGGPLRSGFRSGSGKGAQPRFRRQPGRGTFGRRAQRSLRGGSLRGGSLRGGKLSGGLPRRGRARFGRRPAVWRIGSKRTGGLS